MKSSIDRMVDMQKRINEMTSMSTPNVIDKIFFNTNPYKNALAQISRIGGEQQAELKAELKAAGVPERITVMNGTATIPKIEPIFPEFKTLDFDKMFGKDWLKPPTDLSQLLDGFKDFGQDFSNSMKPLFPSVMDERIYEMTNFTQKIADLIKPIQPLDLKFEELIDVSSILSNIMGEIDWNENNVEVLAEDFDAVVQVSQNAIATDNPDEATQHIGTLMQVIYERFGGNKALLKFFRDVFMGILTAYICLKLFPTEPTSVNNYYIKEASTESESAKLMVNAIEKDLRMKPRNDYASRYCIPIGTELSILQTTKKWSQVSFKGGDGKTYSGWITNDGLE